ncbi:unnamed protein product [Linum tenue]|uniref:Uncharacterized protein n=2 Tax=Linum tenue TaxID=586396 RepID=A0AAV0QKD1_9ROSI|nr:unnamed protein product [Linum tenue]
MLRKPTSPVKVLNKATRERSDTSVHLLVREKVMMWFRKPRSPCVLFLLSTICAAAASC